jgi:hypothetical protein
MVDEAILSTWIVVVGPDTGRSIKDEIGMMQPTHKLFGEEKREDDRKPPGLAAVGHHRADAQA